MIQKFRGLSSTQRNSVFGLLGFLLPSVALFVFYPVLTRCLGADAFGVYLLAISFTSVLSFVDFGFSLAVVRYIAEDSSRADHQAIADIIVTSTLFYCLIGLIGVVALWALAPWLSSVFAIPASLRTESLLVFRIAAFQIGLTMVNTVFLSIFKGFQRFDYSSMVVSILSFMTYGGAAIGALMFHQGVVGASMLAAWSTLAVLLLSAALSWHLCKAHGVAIARGSFSRQAFFRLFGYGNVMMVNSVAQFVMGQCPRYLIGWLLGPSAVTVYTIAFTVASKVHSLINSMIEVLFPLASATKDPGTLRRTYQKMMASQAAIALVPLAVLAIFVKPILTLWVGADLAEQAAPLMPWFALSYFFLALSPAPYHLLNGQGKAWMNSVNLSMLALLFAAFLGLFSLRGFSLMGVTTASALANVVGISLFIVVIEVFVWRRGNAPVRGEFR